MLLRRFGVALFFFGFSVLGIAEKPCLSPEAASRIVDKDICVSAHVYGVVQSQDGTRFLDICTPETPDDACLFTIASRWQDRDEVGELGKFRNSDIRIRGFVKPMHGRFGMELSHERQFHGGRPRGSDLILASLTASMEHRTALLSPTQTCAPTAAIVHL
jgi:hypothetical protein